MNKIKLYFERIGLEFSENLKPTDELLKKLQYAHITHVPYETTDIVDRKSLSLDYNDLFKKIVEEKRGGYCFELNGLFGWLLREIGYEVTEYQGRFLRGEATPPKPRHRVLVVKSEGKDWLCDVGVGCKAPRYPVLMEEGTEQNICGEFYKIEKDDFLGNILMEKTEDGWNQYFSFNNSPCLPVDFTTLSYYCENHPSSPFLNNMLSLKTDKGRYTIDKNTFRIWKDDTVELEKECSEKELEEYCLKYFNMSIHR